MTTLVQEEDQNQGIIPMMKDQGKEGDHLVKSVLIKGMRKRSRFVQKTKNLMMIVRLHEDLNIIAFIHRRKGQGQEMDHHVNDHVQEMIHLLKGQDLEMKMIQIGDQGVRQ